MCDNLNGPLNKTHLCHILNVTGISYKRVSDQQSASTILNKCTSTTERNLNVWYLVNNDVIAFLIYNTKLPLVHRQEPRLKSAWVEQEDVKIQCSFFAGGRAPASFYSSPCIKHNVGISLTDLPHLICDSPALSLFSFLLFFAHKLQMASLKQKHDHREHIKHAAAAT